jgi:hypothetical protein
LSRAVSRLASRSRRYVPRRFVVSDRSMEPTLVDGQGLITVLAGRPAVGQIRCFEHPTRPGFWLVKRVEELNDDGTMTAMSDNRASTLADSRTFGPVPIAGSYRVLVRMPQNRS